MRPYFSSVSLSGLCRQRSGAGSAVQTLWHSPAALRYLLMNYQIVSLLLLTIAGIKSVWQLKTIHQYSKHHAFLVAFKSFILICWVSGKESRVRLLLRIANAIHALIGNYEDITYYFIVNAVQSHFYFTETSRHDNALKTSLQTTQSNCMTSTSLNILM